MIGIDLFFDQFAILDVYRNNAFYGSFPIFGNGTATRQISLGSFDNINKIVIKGITDPSGVGFDDFSFNVPGDVKITSGRVNGSLNGTTQSALLGADVALSATPLPGTFGGGTYAWSCTPVQTCSIVTANNSSSVTLRANEVGTYTVNVSYTKNAITTSSSVTVNSVLPTLTKFTAEQKSDQIDPPFTCEHGFPGAIFWWYGLGCYGSVEGISFTSHIHAPEFISDPNKSGIKYIQAASAFRKRMSRGTRCDTHRSSQSNIDSGWQLDTANPYTCCGIFPVMKFSTAAGLMQQYDFDVHVEDYPEIALTRAKDYDFIDTLYIDDRFEMYVLYFAGNSADAPFIQRPLGKLSWNWGGLVALDWDPNIHDAVHKIRNTNANPTSRTGQIFPSSMQNMNSLVAMSGNVTDFPNDGSPCPGATPFTENPIDSSREFVKYHYKDFLGRDPNGEKDSEGNWIHPPDPTGWNFWTSNFSQCVFDLSCVHTKRISTGLPFFLSSEFMTVDPIMANGPGTPNFDREAYNREFVYWCYLGYLHKFPDQQGWDFWTNDLTNGPDADNYSHMIDSFQLSADYRGRVFE